MKKCKMMKKMTTVLLTMAIAVSLVGCGSGDKRDGKISDGKISPEELKDLVYQSEVLGSTDQLAGDVSYFAVKGDDLYVYTMEMEGAEEDTSTTNQYFYKLKTTGSEPETIFSKLDCGEQNEWLNSFCIAGTGDIYMLYSIYNPKMDNTELLIRILDPQGKEKNTFSLSGIIDGKETFIQTMCLDEENNLYLLTDRIVYVVAPDALSSFG